MRKKKTVIVLDCMIYICNDIYYLYLIYSYIYHKIYMMCIYHIFVHMLCDIYYVYFIYRHIHIHMYSYI